MENQKQHKTADEKFDERIDEIIYPLIDRVLDQIEKELVSYNSLYELFAIAILKGIELSEATSTAIDHLLQPQGKGILEQTMIKHQNFKNQVAMLNLKNGLAKDGKPRFVTPDQIDPVTGKMKL